jgi:hypothetical protein
MSRAAGFFRLTGLTRLSVILLPLVTAAALAQATGTAVDAGAKLGAPVVIFDWKTNKCDHDDSADEPARAFRDRNGQVHLFSTSFRNRQLTGADFNHLRHPCAVVFMGRHSGNPADYDDYGWLASFYTTDGQTVFALVHNEFHGSERPALCPSRAFLRCWETSIGIATSHDGGNSFTRPVAPRNVIAELPYRYQGDQKLQFGYFNPTNILRAGDYFYAMVSMIDNIDKLGGVCIMRTKVLSDPTSWRAWDGHGYNVQFVDPYLQTVANPKQNVCTAIGNGNVFFSLGSVVLHKPSGLFLLAMRLQTWDAGKVKLPVGVYITTSKDLITWSKPKLLLADSALGPPGADGQSAESYPSLIDPNSAGMSFDQSSNHAYLFTVRTLPSFTTDNRQLIRRDVDLTTAMAPAGQ